MSFFRTVCRQYRTVQYNGIEKSDTEQSGKEWSISQNKACEVQYRIGQEGIEENTRGYNVLKKKRRLQQNSIILFLQGEMMTTGDYLSEIAQQVNFCPAPSRLSVMSFVCCIVNMQQTIQNQRSIHCVAGFFRVQSVRSCFAVFFQLTVVKTNKIPRTKREERRARAQQRVREDTFLEIPALDSTVRFHGGWLKESSERVCTRFSHALVKRG